MSDEGGAGMDDLLTYRDEDEVQFCVMMSCGTKCHNFVSRTTFIICILNGLLAFGIARLCSDIVFYNFMPFKFHLDKTFFLFFFSSFFFLFYRHFSHKQIMLKTNCSVL